jgi:hypothetical protein
VGEPQRLAVPSAAATSAAAAGARTSASRGVSALAVALRLLMAGVIVARVGGCKPEAEWRRERLITGAACCHSVGLASAAGALS